MNSILRWIDDRTGLVTATRSTADRPVSGCRTLNAWPCLILFTFVIEAITGLLLWMYYSPSAQTAWESVYYIQHEVLAGAIVRGLHYHAAQVLLALLGLYVLHMIFAWAYRAPRELAFWTAVLLTLVTLALLLTGDVLAWNQRGFWSTNVRTNFLLLLPGVGGALHKLAIGGPEMGHLTLTRFFALHAGLFTAVFILLAAGLWWFVRRAEQAEAVDGQAAPWWPGQALFNAVGCLVVLGVIGAMMTAGVELGSPRDPVDAYAAARPDWYFVGLYQFAAFFPGTLKIVPIFIVPGLLVLFFLSLPLLGRTTLGHFAGAGITAALLVAMGVLTSIAKTHDRNNPEHQASIADEEVKAERVVELIQHNEGVPSTGALGLLWNDPKTQGPKLFKQHCASCHDYSTREGQGILSEKPTAPNLHGFAGREWLTGFLDAKQISYMPKEIGPTDRPWYFGGTQTLKKGKMHEYLSGEEGWLAEVTAAGEALAENKPKDEQLAAGKLEFAKLIDVLAAEATRAPGTKPSDAELKLFDETFTCTSSGCHAFHGKGQPGTAPNLTGYGSREWLIGIISDPANPRFYGKMNERMPSYAPANKPGNAILTARQIEMLADWMREKWE